MSRCFPYPPPGYYRKGAAHDALIESIKLQKETDKTKAEKKKEKKAKKEKKEKRQKEAKIKNPNYVLQKSANFTEAQIKGTKAITEVFEKSDLTEEHGQSISPHQPSYSSDSTQNSNKRKRDDYSLLPDSSTGHGSFKIRFLKKQKGSDSGNYVADVRSNIRPPVPSCSNLDRSLVSSIGNSGVPTTSGRENVTQTKANPVAERVKISDPNRLHFSRIQSASSYSKPILQSTRPHQQVIPRIHLEHEIQSSSVSRNINEQGLSNKTSISTAGKRSINEIPVPANDGVMCLEKQKQEPQKVGPTRTEKKMLKKHSKYEKLIGSWLPPVLQAHLPDVVDDEDWLSSSKRLSSLNCKGEVEACREMVASWQPCARFLAEVDIHALPYTVPF